MYVCMYKHGKKQNQWMHLRQTVNEYTGYRCACGYHITLVHHLLFVCVFAHVLPD